MTKWPRTAAAWKRLKASWRSRADARRRLKATLLIQRSVAIDPEVLKEITRRVHRRAVHATLDDLQDSRRAVHAALDEWRINR